MTSVPNLQLSTGTGTIDIPQLGFGVWQVPDDEVDAAIASALEVGYRSIDTAHLYGNEEGVGRAIAATDLPRDDLFVTTKVWNDDHGFDSTLAAFDASIGRLGPRRPRPLPHPLAHPGARTTTSTPGRRCSSSATTAGCAPSGCATSRSTTCSGSRTRPASSRPSTRSSCTPTSSRPSCASSTRPTGSAPRRGARSRPVAAVLDDPVVRGIAEKHGVTPAQAILRWHLADRQRRHPQVGHPEPDRRELRRLRVRARRRRPRRLHAAGPRRAHRARPGRVQLTDPARDAAWSPPSGDRHSGGQVRLVPADLGPGVAAGPAVVGLQCAVSATAERVARRGTGPRHRGRGAAQGPADGGRERALRDHSGSRAVAAHQQRHRHPG